MPIKLQLTSGKYTQHDFGVTGLPVFAIGQVYEITPEQKTAILGQYSGYPQRVKDSLKLNFSADPEAPTVAIASPPSPPITSSHLSPTPRDSEEGGIVDTADLAELTELTETPDLTELSDDDLDLVIVEIGKLKGRTIAEAEPVLIATGGNPELPRALRVAYLKEVQSDSELQKGLKDIAAKLLEQI